MSTETFTCASCDGTFGKGWSDAEAAAEAEELFPGINEAGAVCEGCYQQIMARVRAEAPELAGGSWRCYVMASGPVHVRPGCRCK